MSGPAPDPRPHNPGMLRGLLSFSSMTMVSRVLGLVRDQSISYVFGATAATDAFWVAFRIPNFMRRLFAEGSFSTAFVPVFTEIKETRPHVELRELVSRVAGTLGAVLLVVTALGLLFSPQIAQIFSPHDTHKLGLLTDLIRLTFPFLLFVSLTALAAGALNSFHRFGLPALAPVILNLCMISGALWLSPRLQVPIMAMGWAVLAAGVLQLLFLLPALGKLGLLSVPSWGWHHAGVRKVMRLMVPTLFGSSVAQINLLLDTWIAAYLLTRSQTWLSLADRFLELPLGVFGIALGTVMLPTLSRHHVRADHAGFSRALDWGLRNTLTISVPAALGLMLLCQPLVATLFQHGHFTAFDTRMTALSVFGLSFGLPAFAMVKVVLPAFYSRQDTKTPVRAGLSSLVANMLLNFAILSVLYVMWVPDALKAQGVWQGLAGTPGLHLALGIASALASYLNLGLLWRWLRRDGVYQAQPGWGRFSLRLLLACAALGMVVGLGLYVGPDFTTAPVMMRLVWLFGLVGAGGAAYAAVLVAMGWRMRELREH
jgi:putative peptidoglycan lipid II flippase